MGTDISTDAGGGASLDAPLRVDWIPDELFGGDVSGRLGLTFLPGKRGPSFRYPGRVYRRALEPDLAALRANGVHALLLLVEDRELDQWGDLDIVARAAAAGLAVERRPMPDGGTPGSIDAGRAIVAWLNEARRGGDVAIACMGGVGRTGTIAACALVDAGLEADAAIGAVRRVRHPTAVETEAQVAYVRSYAASFGRAR